jgi:hypothetical protein
VTIHQLLTHTWGVGNNIVPATKTIGKKPSRKFSRSRLKQNLVKNLFIQRVMRC